MYIMSGGRGHHGLRRLFPSTPKDESKRTTEWTKCKWVEKEPKWLVVACRSSNGFPLLRDEETIQWSSHELSTSNVWRFYGNSHVYARLGHTLNDRSRKYVIDSYI